MSLKDELKTLKDSGIMTLKIENKLNKLFHSDREEREERYGLHASAIIDSENNFCYREQVLSLFFKRNTGHELPTKLLRIFKEGESIHEKWQTMFEKAGIAKYIEKTRFIKKYDLSYTPDAEIELFGDEPIVEIKSMNTFAYQKAKGHPAGEKQINFYLWARRKRWGIVLMEDKNTQDWKALIVKYDKEKVRPYVERLKIIQEYKMIFLESGKLPKKKCKNCDIKRAQECGMRDACWDIGQGRIKLKKSQMQRSDE